ncbi:MAG TPA: flagellar assembly protein FliH [Casimicrobiaceae bacterium]|jgi:flagellar assembly protein FliH
MERKRLSAFQRWELASLDAEPAASATIDPQVLAAARAAAEAEGRAAGYAAGIAAANAERARLDALVGKLSSAAGDHEQRLVDEVLDLALVLARQLVGEALAVRREFILPIVSAALKQLPQSTQRVELMLNPSDVEIVRTFLGTGEFAGRCQILPDASIAPGGCLIETEQCEIDVTVPSRWRRLLAALGRSDDWLEPV